MPFIKYPAGTQLKSPSGTIITADGNGEYSTDFFNPVNGGTTASSTSSIQSTPPSPQSVNTTADVFNLVKNGLLSVNDGMNQISNLVNNMGLSNDQKTKLVPVLQDQLKSQLSSTGSFKQPDGSTYTYQNGSLVRSSTPVVFSNQSGGYGTPQSGTTQAGAFDSDLYNKLVASGAFPNAHPIQTKSSSTVGTTPATSSGTDYNTNLASIINSPQLRDDQKKMLLELFQTVAAGDTAKAQKMKDLFNSSIAYSDPYFKAQVSMVTDALDSALSSNQGDLNYKEQQIQRNIKDLNSNLQAIQGTGSYEQTQEYKNLISKYEQDLEDTRQGLAETGLTNSSVRSKKEQYLNNNQEGLVQSGSRQFNYNVGKINSNIDDQNAQLSYLKDQATQQRIKLLRDTESKIGSQTLTNLGYSGNDVLGSVGGTIPRQQLTDAYSAASGSGFIF